MSDTAVVKFTGLGGCGCFVILVVLACVGVLFLLGLLPKGGER